jgi:hypothetical protein
MGIEKDIDELAKLAHDAWALDNLIQHISSMSEEELKKALPRILKLRGGSENRATGVVEPATRAPVLVLDDSEFSLRGRLCYSVSKLGERSAALIFRLTGWQQYRTSVWK